MDEKKLQEIMQDEEFVKELVKQKTKEDVQKLFKTKGLEIDINELEKLENEGKKMLQDSDLENISGGVDMKTRVASCVLALLPFASSIPARAASIEVGNNHDIVMEAHLKIQDFKKQLEEQKQKIIPYNNQDIVIQDFKKRLEEQKQKIIPYSIIEKERKDFEERVRQATEEDHQALEIIKCASDNDASKLKQLLTEKKYNINARRGRHGVTALTHFVGLNDYSEKTKNAIKLLLENGADPNAKNLSGTTAFHVAVRSGQLETVKLLLEYGADVNAKDEYFTVLMEAIIIGNIDVVKLLLEKGADVNAKANGFAHNNTSINVETALMAAVERGNIDMVKLLLENDANVNLGDHNGITPLMYAVEKEYTDVVKLLLENGADPNVNTRAETVSPEWVYRKFHTDDHMKFYANMYSTALIIAVHRNNADIIKILLEHGADVNLKNGLGRTAIDLAYGGIAKLLRSAQNKAH